MCIIERKDRNFSRIKLNIERNFLYACEFGKLELVNFFLHLQLKGEYLIDIYSNVGDEAFQLACKYNQVEVIKRLDEEGRIFKPDTYKSGLEEACRYGHIEVVKFLLSLEGERCMNGYLVTIPFYRACDYNRMEIVKLLLELKGKQRIPKYICDRALTHACSRNKHECIKLFLSLEGDSRFNDADTLSRKFWLVCGEGNLEAVKLFLDLEGDRRIDVHYDDERAFRMACQYNHLEVVKLLLSLEGDRRIDIYIRNYEAFYFACNGSDSRELIKLFLELQGDRKIPRYIIPTYIPKDLLPKDLLPKAKPTTSKCLITLTPIEENEEYVTCTRNDEHAVKYVEYIKTNFYNRCLICGTETMKKYINTKE